MLIASLFLLLVIMLIAVLVILDSRFQSFFEKTRLGKYAKPVFTVTLALLIITLAGAAWVYKTVSNPVIPASGDRNIYQQLVSEYESKGIQFSEQSSGQPETRWVRGCNSDHSININIFSDKQLNQVKAYQVIVTTSAAGELAALVQAILPGWSQGPAWIAQNQNQSVINSTTYQDAYIELCANSEGSNKALVSYYLGIYPHGYVDI